MLELCGLQTTTLKPETCLSENGIEKCVNFLSISQKIRFFNQLVNAQG